MRVGNRGLEVDERVLDEEVRVVGSFDDVGMDLKAFGRVEEGAGLEGVGEGEVVGDGEDLVVDLKGF